MKRKVHISEDQWLCGCVYRSKSTRTDKQQYVLLHERNPYSLFLALKIYKLKNYFRKVTKGKNISLFTTFIKFQQLKIRLYFLFF